MQLTAADLGGAAAPPDMGRAALDFVEVTGYRIFPLWWVGADGSCACRARGNCDRPGKHGWLKWKESASADPQQIERWWRDRPHANIALLTGAVNALRVIDVDSELGEETLRQLESKLGELPPTVEQTTGNGRHLFFRCHDPTLGNVKLGPKLDSRGAAGYVVLAPSLHRSGRRYRAHPTRTFGLFELAAWPQRWSELPRAIVPPAEAVSQASALPSLTRTERYAAAALAKECATVRSAPAGSRNTQLNASAFSVALLAHGGALDSATAKHALRDAALASGLGELEIVRTLASAFAAAAKADVRTGPQRDLPRVNGTAPHGGASGTNGATLGGGGWEPPGPSEDTVKPVEPEAKTPRIEIVGAREIFAPLGPQQWVVPELQLGPGRPTLIAGYGSSGKTLAVQALALAVASGRPVWGKFPTDRLRILHLDYEQTFRATARRYQRLALAMGIDPVELEGTLALNPQLPELKLDHDAARDVLVELAENFDLIVLDCLRAGLDHTDENDSRVRGVIDKLTYASQHSGAAFALIHHAGKPKDAHKADARTLPRGSSAIYDACGCVLNFVSKPGTPTRTVTQVKTPAEAEGGGIEAFELLVEDVMIDGVPKAGVRVVHQQVDRRESNDDAERAYNAESSKLVDFISRNPGKAQCEIVAKAELHRGKAHTVAVLNALEAEGRVRVVAGEKNSRRYFAVQSGAAK
jgi:Bifunctional DNA primase/polymerase, N-terminal/AAA domain